MLWLISDLIRRLVLVIYEFCEWEFCEEGLVVVMLLDFKFSFFDLFMV